MISRWFYWEQVEWDQNKVTTNSISSKVLLYYLFYFCDKFINMSKFVTCKKSKQ